VGQWKHLADSVSGVPQGYLATPWYKKLAARLSLRFGTVVLVVSRFMVADVRTLGACEPIVVPNSVDTNVFRPSDDHRLHVTTILNLDDNVVRLKRGEVFLLSVPIVLRTYPQQTFAVIGRKGNAFERLFRLASDLEIQGRVDFVGSLENSDVVRWLQRSKVYVQISDTETFGVAIAEAMSSGTTVLISDRGAIPELVGSHGVFVDHNNPQSVASGIISLLAKTEEERQWIGAEARARIIEHFSYEKRRVALQRIIDDLSSFDTRRDQHRSSAA
jgi:glycosyltransferase involved in cell wall biosynthesis